MVLSAVVAVTVAPYSRALGVNDDNFTGATNASWDTPTNWSLGAKPGGTNTAGFLTLTPAGRTITLGSNEAANDLVFGSGTVLEGGNLVLTTGQITVNPNGTIVSAANPLFSNATPLGGTLLTSLGGSSGLTTAGTGVLVLGGINTYTGTNTVAANSALRIDRSSNLGVAANGLTLSGNLQVANTGLARTLTVGGTAANLYVARNAIATYDGILTGSAGTTLTRTGQGILVLRNVNTFAGDLVIAPNQGGVTNTINAGTFAGTELRDTGTLLNVNSLTIGQGSEFGIENDGTNAAVNNDRLNNSAPITLGGGSFHLHTKAGLITTEAVGAFTLASGHSTIRGQSQNANSAAIIETPSVNRTAGSGATVVFAGWQMGLTATSDVGRVRINDTGGTGAGPSLTNNLIGGWALALSDNSGALAFASYKTGGQGVGRIGDTTNGYLAYDSTDLATATANQNVDQAAATTAGSTTGAVTLNSLRVSTTAASTYTLNGTLTVNSGGVLTSANNATNVTFANGTGGSLTSGGSELFMHVQQNTTAVNVPITNGTGAVTLVKTLGGTLALGGANTYTGGTFVNGGTLSTGATAGQTYLGTGAVVVDNATLTLGATGATSFAGSAGTPAYRVTNISQLNLPTAGVVAGEYIAVGAGSTVSGGSTALFTLDRGIGGGTPNITLAPDSIVSHTAFGNDAGNGNNTVTNREIQNLGTNADLYFGLAADFNAGPAQGITIGAGTPWKGMSSDRNNTRRFNQGTITIAAGTTDVYFQGTPNSAGGGTQLFYFGNGATSSPTIAQADGNDRPVVHFLGGIQFDGTGGTYPNTATYLAEPGSTITFSQAAAMGAGTPITLQVGNGGRTLITNSAAINGTIRVQPGGLFNANQAGGLTGTGTINVDAGGILQIDNTAGITGTQADPVNARFNLAPGAIVRVNANNITSLGTRIGTGSIIEMFSTQTLTSQTTPENVTVGGLTNHPAFGTTVNTGSGRILIPAGGAMFGSSGANNNLTVSDDWDLQGNTLTIGSADSVGGSVKIGLVSLGVGGNRSTGGGGVVDIAATPAGSLVTNRLQLNAVNAIPDSAIVNIGAGSILDLNQSDRIETVGGLTGSGDIVTVGTGTIPGPHLRVSVPTGRTDVFAGRFLTGTGQPKLTKIGPGTLVLTGVSTSTGNSNTAPGIQVDQGTVIYRDGGKSIFFSNDVNRGGTLTLDNTATALDNRLGGSGVDLDISGGTFNLIGSPSAAVNETFANVPTNRGGTGFINITPGAGGATRLAPVTLGGRSISTLVVNGANFGGTPGAGVSTFVATTTSNALGAVTQSGQSALRPDILTQSPVTGAAGSIPLSFTAQTSTTTGLRAVTGSELYPGVITSGNNSENFLLSTGATFVSSPTPGQPNVDTQFGSLTLTAGSTGITNSTGVNYANAQARTVIKSGGVLVRPGVTATIASPYLDTGNAPIFLHVYNTDGATTAASSLTVNAPVVASAGSLVKAGDGALTFGPGTLRTLGATGGGYPIGINGGSVTLGANNVLPVGLTGNVPVGQDLYLTAGSIDVKGNSQFLRIFTSANNINSNSLPNTGGTYTNTGAQATLTFQGTGNLNPDIGNFGSYSNNFFTGSVAGALDLLKVNNNGQTYQAFNNVNDFNGTFTSRGGGTILKDSGTFPNVSAITLNYSGLYLDNQYSLSNVNNRVNTTAPVTMRGGVLELRGQAGTVSNSATNITQTFASVTLDAGQNFINNFAGQSGSSDMVIGTFARNAANGTTVDFRGNNLGRYTANGQANNAANQDSRIIINAGLPATATYSGSSPSISNGFFGGWAVANENDFVAYLVPPAGGFAGTSANVGGGVIPWGSGNGAPAYTTVTNALTPGTGNFATGVVGDTNNADVTLGTTGSPATFLIGALRISNNATRQILFNNNTDVLNVESGAILRVNQNNASNFGNTTNRGIITVGGSSPAAGTLDFNVFANQNTMTMNSVIVNNPAGNPVRLVKNLGGTLTLTGFNTYTGGTIVHAGTLSLASTNAANGTAGNVTVPGDLLINGSNPSQSAVVTLATQGQILNTATVSINNGGTLNLSAATAADNTTLAALSFTNVGGANPNINATSAGSANTPTKLTLTNVGPGGALATPVIAAVNDHVGGTPIINGTNTNSSIQLDFVDNTTNREINTTGQSPIGLVINAAIVNGRITKTGPTMLALGSPTAATGILSTFTGGLQINAGQVRVDATTALGGTAGTPNLVTVGTGTPSSTIALVLNNDTANTANLSLNGGVLTQINGNRTVNGNVAVASASTVRLNDYAISAVGRQITVAGVMSGSAALNLEGTDNAGTTNTLVLNNTNNTYTGTFNVGPNVSVTATSTGTGSSIGGNYASAGTNRPAFNMAGGTLNIRDNGSASGVTLGLTEGYGNNVTVTGNATINVDRVGANTSNTIALGNLSVGNATATVHTNANSYNLSVASFTATSPNTTLNRLGGGVVNLPQLDGTAGANFTRVGSGVVAVNGNGGTLSGSVTVGGGVLRFTSPTGNALNNRPTVNNFAGTLQGMPASASDTVTFNPASIVNDGAVHAAVGTTTFGNKFIGGTYATPTVVNNALSERYYRPNNVAAAAFTDAHIQFENANTGGNTLATTYPQAANLLTGNQPLYMGFSQMLGRSGLAPFTTTPSGTFDNLGAGFVGRITVGGPNLPAGVVSFGTDSDDGTSVYVDVNQNGVFEASEMLVNNLGGHGLQKRQGAANLAAGTYNFAVGFYNGGGATQDPTIDVRFGPGGTVATPLAFDAQKVINPGDPTQAGVFSTVVTSGRVQVDAGAVMTSGGFAVDHALLAGPGTAPVININDNGQAKNSSANRLTLAGASAGGVLNITANTMSVGVLDLATTSVLFLQGGGRLLVNGTPATAGSVGTGSVQVTGTNTTLGGIGRISGQVDLATDTVLAPGDGPGVLSIAGPLNLAAGSKYAVQLGGTTPGNTAGSYDQTNVTLATGTVLSLADSVLNVSNVNGFGTNSASQVFYILTQGGTTPVVGEFAGLPEGATVTLAGGAGTAKITYLANWTGVQGTSTLTGGNDVALYNPSIVPEPASAGVLAAAAVGLLARRRRRSTQPG